MDTAELIETIKTETRSVSDCLNRTLETVLSKASLRLDAESTSALEEMCVALGFLKAAVEHLEAGANNLRETAEKVA